MPCNEIREMEVDLAKVGAPLLVEALTAIGYRVTLSMQNDGLFFTRAAEKNKSAVTGRATPQRFRLLCSDIAQAEAEVKQAVCWRALLAACKQYHWSLERCGSAARVLFTLAKDADQIEAEIHLDGSARLSTGAISAPQHKSAESLLRFLAQSLGGRVTLTKLQTGVKR